MRNLIFGFITPLILFGRVAGAQSLGKMLGDDFTNAAKDVVAIWGSPFDASGRDWLLTAAAFGAFGASMAVDKPVSDWALRNDSAAFFRAIKPVRRGGILFSGKYVVPPVAAVYVIGLATRNRDMRDFVTGCMAAWGAQSAIRKTVYLALGRARPDTLPDDSQNWRAPSGGSWEMHSFPAGHFANAMACASYWNHRFHLGAASPLVYGVAGLVGIGRLADGAHWMSDTVLGGILGYAVGMEIGRRSAARAGATGMQSAGMIMSPGPNGTIIGWSWTF